MPKSPHVQPAIILVNPQMGENIGASARAMLNCGLTDMRIVNPRDGWPNERAIANGVGAFDKMFPVQMFGTVSDALKEFNYVYATTARPRDMVKPVFTAQSAIEDMRKRHTTKQKTAILFGAERTGLTNEELAQADAIITILLNPEFASLNLAQGVLLCAYEWSKSQYSAPEKFLPTGDSIPVLHEEFDRYLSRLEDELEKHHFFRNPDLRPTLIRNIRSLYSRAEPTDQEIKTLQGILSALIGNKLQ